MFFFLALALFLAALVAIGSENISTQRKAIVFAAVAVALLVTAPNSEAARPDEHNHPAARP